METQSTAETVGNHSQIVDVITESVQSFLDLLFAGFNETTETADEDPQFI